jgi:glycosyltransferase involved in cell wall biosynthesis
MDYGLVSFIIRVRNTQKEHLHDSLKSALSQTYSNIEVIVVFDKGDQNKDDGIRDVLSQFESDSRLKVFYREKGGGHIEAMNYGITKANGKFIAVLDSDDKSFENRILHQLQYMINNKLNFVGSWIYFISEGEGLIAELRTPVSHNEIRNNILIHTPFAHSSIIYEKEILEKIGYYDPGLSGSEEYEFYLRVMGNGFKVGNVPEHLCYILQRHDSLLYTTWWDTRKGYVTSKFRAIRKYHFNRPSDIFYALISPIAFLVPISKQKAIISKLGWYRILDKH